MRLIEAYHMEKVYFLTRMILYGKVVPRSIVISMSEVYHEVVTC